LTIIDENIFKLKMIQVRSLGIQWEYSWTDDLGFHQYFCEKIGNSVEKIRDFTRKHINDQYVYSWNDNLGFHQYFC
jgi:hypothetical protein